VTAATVRAPQPGNEKGRLAGRPLPKPSNSNADNLTPEHQPTQCLTLVPRIIATHWLRPEQVEAAND
jgi:hypothetical protein